MFVTILILLETPLQYRWKTLQMVRKQSQSLFYWKLLCNGFMNFYKNTSNKSQSLFYWKLLCNFIKHMNTTVSITSQSLFYWKLLCNQLANETQVTIETVTILILLETPLQLS